MFRSVFERVDIFVLVLNLLSYNLELFKDVTAINLLTYYTYITILIKIGSPVYIVGHYVIKKTNNNSRKNTKYLFAEHFSMLGILFPFSSYNRSSVKQNWV